jgi:hypothetical protein
VNTPNRININTDIDLRILRSRIRELQWEFHSELTERMDEGLDIAVAYFSYQSSAEGRRCLSDWRKASRRIALPQRART